MIKVVVKKIDEAILSVRISGHAYSGEPGHDLVCAGVSSVVFGILNSIKDVDTSFRVKISDGLVELTPLYRPSNENKIILDVLMTSLKTIEENYGKYIAIREEREKKV